MSGITVVIPSIPDRAHYLAEAVSTVASQRRPPEAIIVTIDTDGQGAAATRTRGLMQVQTEWTAFLDDDDRMLPQHLEHLMAYANEHECDMVFPWFNVIGRGADPFPMNEHREYDPEDPHQTTITMLVRTAAAKKVGGFAEVGKDAPADDQGNRQGEDFRFVLALAKAGYKIGHLHERTWEWRHWQGNTSGQAGNVPQHTNSHHPNVRPKGTILANGEVGYVTL